MADGRGGRRAGAGRKTKAETLQLDKLLDECVSDDDIKELFGVLVKNGKRGNINAIMALLAYRYGKPKERVELSGDKNNPVIVKGYFTINPDDWDQADSDVQPAAVADQAVARQVASPVTDG